MTRTEVIKTLSALGKAFKDDSIVAPVVVQAYVKNAWFTEDQVQYCLNVWSRVLTPTHLEQWGDDYGPAVSAPKRIGIVMAGNIPLVGFHDLVCVLMSGHRPVVKLSSSDEVLVKFCIDFINNHIEDAIEIVERIKNVDGIIATGSNNTARYFEYYYKGLPKIIRKNRTSVAFLDGHETPEDLASLADDVFRYFGLGCRNVTQIYVPKDYDLVGLLDCFQGYQSIADHHKYANNYTYHKAIFLMNQTPHLDTGYLLVKEDDNLHSPLACLFYTYYDPEDAATIVATHQNDIQAVVSNMSIAGAIPFGSTQDAGLSDYADGINTMEFLTKTEFN